MSEDITRRIITDEPEGYEGEDEEKSTPEALPVRRGPGRPRKNRVDLPVGVSQMGQGDLKSEPEETEEPTREPASKDPILPEGFFVKTLPTIDKLKVGGVMPGAGGVLIGAVMAGFHPEYIIDNRKFIHFKTWDYNYSQYKTRFSQLINSYRDMPVDLIVGSPSCAKFSKRGKKIIDGKPLEEVPPEIFEYVMFLEEIVQRRPRFFILENVPGVRRYFWFEKHPDGGYLLRSEKFKTGIHLRDYEIQEEFLDTHDFGLPQYRKRLYLIGALTDYDFIYRPPKFLKSTTVSSVLDDIKDSFGELVNHEAAEFTDDRIKDFRTLKPGEAAYTSFGNKRLDPDSASPTIMGGASRFVHYDRDRLLTPRECARIMGFPDDYVFWGGLTQQYDQIGKGVSPPVITHIASQVVAALEKKGQIAIPDIFKPKKRWLPKIKISFEKEV